MEKTEAVLTPKQQKNYDHLTGIVFPRMGFEGVFDRVLKVAMQLGKTSVELKAEDKGPGWKMDFTVPLNRKDAEDFFFLNNIKTTLHRDGKPDLVHDFLLYNQQGYSIPEMMHMLEGRSVCTEFRKEGRNVELSRRIDFNAQDEKGNNLVRTTYHSDNGFSYAAEVNKIPASLSADDKKAIVAALKRGELVNVIIKRGPNREKVSIEATPHLNKNTYYNEKGDKISLTNTLKAVGEEEGQKLSETTQALANSDNNQRQGQEQSRGRQRA